MVQQILTFARGSGGQQSIIHTQQLVREMGKIITDTFPKAILCRVQASNDTWRVSGLAVQLHQVIMNLCVNARDAMPNGGTLVLIAENVILDEAAVAKEPAVKPGRYLCLSVRDTGTGIPKDKLPQIFQPFFTTKAPGRGTGLGLSTSQTIVQNHGGFITVESTIGRGTEFKVFLPAVVESIEGEMPVARAALPIGKGELILVVDDETAILALAQSSLEAHGYKVLTAANGPSAIWTFSREHANVRLVIMDKSMPFMDGVATLTALRRIKPEVKVLVASGHDLQQKTETDRRLKADGLIEKPFTVEQLVMAVHHTL
jgi:CheY-like chemotaxis protein